MDENIEIIGGGGNNGGTGGEGGNNGGAGGNGGGGGSATDWQAFIPEATRTASAEVLKGFANDGTGLENLLKGYTESQKLIGQKGLMKLPENATDDQRKAFDEGLREVLGVPKDIAGYGELPAEVDGVKADTKLREGFLGVAHKIGLSPDQVKAVDAWSFEVMKALQADDAKTDAEFEVMAKQAFGANANASVEQAKVLLGTHVQHFKGALAGLDNNSLLVMAEAMLNMQKAMGSEDTPLNANSNPGGGGKSMDEVRQEKLTLMQDKSYTNAFDPKHEATKKRVLELNQLEYDLKARASK